MADSLMTMLRDWQDYHERQPAGLPEALAFKAAALEIERLRGLVDSFREILDECQDDFHSCEACGHQDDNATRDSDLYIMLRAAVREQTAGDCEQNGPDK
jgi:hypothetical protein